MRNPNQIDYVTRKTSTEFIQEYGYWNNHSMFQMDLADIKKTYGEDRVTVERKNGKYWIIVKQRIF